MSGRKFSFEVTKTSSAPAATLFRLVTDGGNWATWAKPIVAQSSWARRGDPAPGGIGAIRKLGMWPVFVQEETVEYEQDRRHVYKLVGARTPVQDYFGEVVPYTKCVGRYRSPLEWLVYRKGSWDGAGDAGGAGWRGQVLRGSTGEGGRAGGGAPVISL